MARLEFEFVSIGANGIDNDINKINNNFKGLHGTIEQNIQDNLKLANQLKEVRQQLKETGNSNVALSQSQRELQQRYNDSNAIIRQQINAFDKTDGSLAQMRSSLSLANRAFDNLNKTARDGSIGQNLSKQIATLTDEIKKAEQATGRFQRNVGNYQQAQSGANGVAMEFNRIIQDAPYGMMGIGNNIQQLAANWQTYTSQAKAAAAANGTTVTTMGLVKGAMVSILSPANLLTLGIAAITSAITFMSMNSKKASEDIKTLNNTFTQQASALENIIFLTSQQANTERDKATAVGLYNKELGDTLGKVKTYAELERKLIKSGSDYIKYLQAKGLAEASYQKILQQTGMIMDSIQTLSSEGSVDVWGKITKFGRDFKKTMNININDGLKDAITMQEQVKILMMEPWKAEEEIKKYTFSVRQGLYKMRGQQAGQSEMRQLWADLTKSSNEYADAIGGIKMPDLGSDLDKNNESAKSLFDYLTKIKELLGDKRKDLDMFGLKGEQKELKELEYSFKDFFSELDKLSSKLSKDKSIGGALKKSIQGEIANAKKLGEELKELQGNEISNKWIEERTKLIDDMYSKVEDVSIIGLDKELANWSKEVDKFKESIISSGVPLAQFQATIDDLIEKGSLKIKVDFAIQHLEEIDKLEKQIQDLVNKPFSTKNKDGLIKQTEERKKEVQALYDVLVQVMKLGYDGKGTGGFKLSEEDIQKTLESLKLQIEANAKKQKEDRRLEKDIQDYVSIANNSINSLFTNLETNVKEFGLGFNSVLFSASDTLKSMFDSLNSKNNSDFITKLTEVNKNTGLIDIKENWKSIKNDTVEMSKAIGSAIGMVGNLVSNLSKSTSGVGQGVGGALSGAGAGLSMGTMLKDTLGKNGGLIGAGIGAAVGLIGGIFGAKKARKQEELQRKQLLEQQKANALLERMNRLAYASQIVGGRTEYGVVSGVNRNEFGEIVFKINGSDLVASLDRTNKNKGR